MSSSKESDVSITRFEDRNFTGWLVQFKAHQRKHGAHVILERSLPANLDPIPLNTQQRRVFNDDLAEYDHPDSIEFSDLIRHVNRIPR